MKSSQKPSLFASRLSRASATVLTLALGYNRKGRSQCEQVVVWNHPIIIFIFIFIISSSLLSPLARPAYPASDAPPPPPLLIPSSNGILVTSFFLGHVSFFTSFCTFGF